MSKEYMSESLMDTTALAKVFVENIVSPEEYAAVYGLQGDLGSGKTTFVKEVAEVLGVNREDVTSPTFVIEKIYAIKHASFTHLIHIDAYRLEKSEELLHLGWDEITNDPHNLILIEWPEKVSDIMPPYTQTLELTFINETTRKILLP